MKTNNTPGTMEYKTIQKEIKRLIKAGAAIELTDTKTVPALDALKPLQSHSAFTE